MSDAFLTTLWIGAAVLVVVGLLVGILYLPTATATVSVQGTPLKADVTLLGAPGTTGGSADHFATQAVHAPLGVGLAFALLADELRKRDFDVWFLDWRGSHLVSGRYIKGTQASSCANLFTIDCVARIDIPEALARIRALAKADSLKVVAHCLGSGALAQSIAEGNLDGLKLSHVVFSTLIRHAVAVELKSTAITANG